MNNDLDSWLSSLGFEEEETQSPEATPVSSPPVVSAQPVDISSQPSESTESQEPVSLSNEDFDDILNDYGFSRPEDAQAEEIIEEDNTEEQLEFNPEDVRDENFEITTDTTADSEEGEEEEENTNTRIILGSGVLDRIASSIPVVQVDTAIEVDNNGRRYVDLSDGHRVYLHNEVVDAVNFPTEVEVEHILGYSTADTTAPLESSTSPINPVDSVASIPEPLIPLNSPTLLLDETTTRFSGAEWFNEIQKQHIIVAGCGGIGSWLILQLARMHPAGMAIYDDDRVEAVNMAGQLYARRDIGNYKVTAISNMISAYTNANNIYAISERFTATTEAGDVMMCGFDSMEARRTFFNSWQSHVWNKPMEERDKCLFLDGRLSIDTLQVLCIRGDDTYNMSRYRDEFLFSDSDADATVCSMKQTTYLACMIGSVMTNLFTNWVANSLDPVIPYDLPFFTEYDAQNMIFKTEK